LLYEYRLDKSPKFMFRNSSLCRTWPLAWCLECADLNTSRYEDLHWLPVSQRVVFKTALMVWMKVISVIMVSLLSQRPLRTRYGQLRSSASAICSDWHSTGSTRPDCNWTTKFRSQRTSHMEPSATSTTVTRPVGDRLQAGTKDAPVLDRTAPLRRFH